MCSEGYSPPPVWPAVWWTTTPRVLGWGPCPRYFHTSTARPWKPVLRATSASPVRYGIRAPLGKKGGCPAGAGVGRPPAPAGSAWRGLAPLVVAGPVLRAAPAVDPDDGEDLHVRHTHIDGTGLGGRARVGARGPSGALGGVVAPVEQDFELAVVEGAGPQHRGHARVADGAGAVTEHAGVGDGERAVHVLDGRGQLDDGLAGVALDG